MRDMSFEWFLLTLDIIIFPVMAEGFHIWFVRDRGIFLAISEIPNQISTLYNDHSSNNNYYVQLRRHGEIQSAETTNTFIHSTNRLALRPPPPTQEETIESETIDESLTRIKGQQ
ncbi:unnamed protein product [Orchesella dallaii]|uniref:Uncharacterized protein n=1 Tax=Orchesella dallaii TaxID=48710 RepID=A0ABP1S1T3_9HEXA